MRPKRVELRIHQRITFLHQVGISHYFMMKTHGQTTLTLESLNPPRFTNEINILSFLPRIKEHNMWQNVECQKSFKYYDQKTDINSSWITGDLISVTENHRNHQNESLGARRLSVAAHQVDDKRPFNVRLESCGYTKRLEQRESHLLSALTIKESFTDIIRVF